MSYICINQLNKIKSNKMKTNHNLFTTVAELEAAYFPYLEEAREEDLPQIETNALADELFFTQYGVQFVTELKRIESLNPTTPIEIVDKKLRFMYVVSKDFTIQGCIEMFQPSSQTIHIEVNSAGDTEALDQHEVYYIPKNREEEYLDVLYELGENPTQLQLKTLCQAYNATTYELL